MLKLFYAPGTCALASRIALEEAGAEYELARLDFSKNEQRSEEYLKINPKGRVPSLVTDKGILTETPAILVYIAQAFPAANLAMLDDPFEFARLQAFNSYIASYRLDGARESCPRAARGALGERAGLLRRYEGKGAGDHGDLDAARRTRSFRRSLGHGRAIYRCRSLSFHHGWVAAGRWR
jgi:glutathione S-transferase